MLTTILSILFIAAFPLLLGFTNKYHFLERDLRAVGEVEEAYKASIKWHRYQFLFQGCFFGLVWLHMGYEVAIIGAFYFSIVFDAYIAKYALGQKIWYLGNTTYLDVTLKTISRWVGMAISSLIKKKREVIKLKNFLSTKLFSFLN